MIRPASPPPRPWRPREVRSRPRTTPRGLRVSKLRAAFEGYVRHTVLEVLAEQAGPIHYHELRCHPDLRPIDWRAVRAAVDALVVVGEVIQTEDGDRLEGPHPIRLSRYALAPDRGEGVMRG